jgi:hypothetical protein
VEAALPADFDEQLAQHIADFETASTLKHGGRTGRVGSTVGLTAKVRQGSQAGSPARLDPKLAITGMTR